MPHTYTNTLPLAKPRRGATPPEPDQMDIRLEVQRDVAKLNDSLNRLTESSMGSHTRAALTLLRTRLNAIYQRHQDR